MRKKYLSALLFGALLVTSAGTFTSCKDYDDEINNLQEQVDALKNKATVSPDEMKTAVSEAIAALEAKLNEAISGKADAAEVKELIEKVTELQNLVNSNEEANEEQIKRLQKEIADLTEKVNAIPGDLDKIKKDLATQKTELENKIAELEKKISESEAGVTAEMQEQLDKLVSDLTETNNKLSEAERLIGENGKAIAEIQTAIADLQDLRDDITSLQEFKADKAYVDSQIEAVKALIPTDYLTAEGVNAAIESALENYVSLEYMAAYSTTAEIRSLIGDAVVNTLSAVEVMIKDAFKVNGYDKETFEAVVKHMNDVNTALKDAEFENIADLINTVKTLEGSYATSEAVEALDKIINGVDGNGGLVADVAGLKTWQGTTNDAISSLKTKISTLVSSLRSMIQSISIVPFEDSKDTDITFNSLYFVNNGEAEPLTVSKEITLTLKVSPTSALTKTFAKDYTVSVIEDKFASRSGATNFEVKKYDDIDLNKGLVKVTIASNKEVAGFAPLCINVKSNAVESADNENVNTNINSDYFIAKTSTWYIIPEGPGINVGKWFQLESAPADLTVDKTDGDIDSEDEKIDFKAEKAEIRVASTVTSTADYKDIKDLNLPEDFVNIAYETVQIPGVALPFEMEEGVLKYKGEQGFKNALAGKKGKVKATLTLGEGEKAKTTEFTTGEITLKIIDQCIVDNIDAEFNYATHQYKKFSDGKYAELAAKLNISNDATGWSSVQISSYPGGYINFWTNSGINDNKPFVYINNGTIQESPLALSHEYSLLSGALKVTLKTNATSKLTWTDFEVVREEHEWLDDNILIPFVYHESNPKLEFGNLSTIFSNYDEIKQYVQDTFGATGVEFKVTAVSEGTPVSGLATLSGSENKTLIITPSKYNGEEITVTLVAKFTGGAQPLDIEIPNTTAKLQMSELHDLSGQIVPNGEENENISIELKKVEGVASPTAAFVLKNDAGVQKWDWRIMYNGEWKSAYTKLGKYNLKFELDLDKVIAEGGTEKASDWLFVDGQNYDTKVSIKSDKYQLANLQRDLVFTIPVVFTSPWQAMQPNSFSEVRKNITVTIKKWSSND